MGAQLSKGGAAEAESAAAKTNGQVKDVSMCDHFTSPLSPLLPACLLFPYFWCFLSTRGVCVRARARYLAVF